MGQVLPSPGLAYGAIDGRPVPECFLEVWQVGAVEELVLATDGYPTLESTLELAEEELRREIVRDPLKIGVHSPTKGCGFGQLSFDDRAYLRIAL